MSSRFLNHSFTSTTSVPGGRQAISQPYTGDRTIHLMSSQSLCIPYASDMATGDRVSVLDGTGPVH